MSERPPHEPPGEAPPDEPPPDEVEAAAGPAADEPGSDEPGPGGPWWRPFVKPLVGAAVLLALLAAGVVFLSQSAWTAERVRRLVETRMSEYLERDVEVGRVEYGFRPGSFVLYDLVIPSPSPDDPPFAVVPRTEIQFALSGFTRVTIDIRRVEVDRPVVNVLFFADGTNNLPELQRPKREGPSRVEVKIGRLLVEGGTVHLDQRQLPLEIDASAVLAFAESAGEAPGGGDRFVAVAAAQDFRIVLPDAEPWFGSVAAKGAFTPGRVDVTGGWARGPGLAARYEGFYAWTEERREAVIEVEAAGDAELARRLGYVEEAIDGAFGFAGTITIDEEDVSYAGRVTSDRLRYGPRTFLDVLAELAGDAEELAVDVERAGHAGGTLSGVVRVGLGGASAAVDNAAGEDAAATARPVAVDGRFRGVAIEEVLADLDLETDLLSRLTGRAGGTLDYRFSSDAPLAGSGEATIRLAGVRGATEGLPLSGGASLTIDDGVLASDDVDLTAPGQRLTAAGRYDLEGERGRFDFRLATEDPGRLLGAIPPIEIGDPPPAWFPTAGRGTAAGTVVLDPNTLDVTATIDLRDVVTPTLELARLSAPVAYRDGVVSTTGLVATGPEQRLAASGRYDVEAASGRFDFELATQDPGDLLRTVPAIEIGDPLPAWFPTAGRGTAAGSVSIRRGEVDLVATVDLRDVVTSTLELARLSAPIELRHGVLSTTGLLAEGPEQRLAAAGRYDFDRRSGRFDFDLATEDPGALLRSVPAIEIGDPPPDWFPLEGRGTAVGSVEIAAGVVDLDATLDFADVVTPALRLTSLEGPIRFRDGAVSTSGLTAIGPEQRLTLAGRYDLDAVRGSVDFRLQSEDVGQIVDLLPLDFAETPAWLPSGGRGTVTGSLAIAPGPTVTGRTTFDLAEVVTPAGRFDTLVGSFRLTPDAVRDLRLEASADGGALIAAGDVPLPLDAGDLGLTIDAVDFPVELLAAFVPQLPPVTGRLTARFDAIGAFDQLVGEAEIDTGPVTVAGVELLSLQADVSFRGPRLIADRLVAETTAGTVEAVGTWNRATGAIAFQATGDDLALGLPPFSELVPGDLAGLVDVVATVEGTVGRPRVAARLVARDLSIAGRTLGDEGRATLVARWDGETVVANGSLLGLVAFDGGGVLTTDRADLAFRVASDDVGALVQLATERPIVDQLSGSFVGTLTVAGPWEEGVVPDVGLTLPSLTLVHEERRIENLEPIELRLAAGRLVVDSLFLGTPGGDDELFVVGSVELDGAQALDLRVQADVDPAWIELLVPDVDLEGELQALAVVGGTLTDPRFSGQASLLGGEALLAGFPHAFEDLEATALLYPGRIVLDNVTAKVAGGDVRMAGTIELVDLAAGRFDYRLQAQVADVSVRFPEGFMLRGDANVTLVSRPDGQLLAGTVDLDRAFYLQDVPAGLGQLLQGVFQRTRLEVAAADEDLAGTQLNVAVLGPGALRVRNNVANLEGDVDLVIRGTLARPVILGQVEIDAGGDVVYADNDYEVERGLLTFANPRRIDPVIDFVATTEVRSYDITLNLAGTIDRLNATFTSDPPLADLEIVSLLTTGQQIADSGRLFAGDPASAGGAPGAAATQFLYGQAASVISERVNTLFGFDRFRVAPVAAGGAGQGALAFTVGKQITRDLFVTYSRDPSTSDLDLLQVEWQMEDNVVVVFTQRGDGSYAVDVQVERRF